MPPLSAPPVLAPIAAAARLIRTLGGFGTVDYQVADGQALVHARTVATVKPANAAERADVALFLDRLRQQHDLQPGDTLQLRYDAGQLVLAVITRMNS